MRSNRPAAPALLAAALAVLALLVACGGAPPDSDVPPADPELEAPRTIARPWMAGLDGFLGLASRLGYHSGYVAMIARDGHVLHATTAGHADLASERPMRLDTRFRMASMTKPVTAVAALILIEEGRLGLDDPVASYVPAAGGVRVATSHSRDANGTIPTEPLARALTVRDLLNFRSGIGARADDSDLGRLWAANDIYAGSGSLGDRVNRIFTAPLYEQPGTAWRYGWSADVLARVVEVAAGEPYDRFLAARIFEPLAMKATSFLPSPSERARMATVYTQNEDGDLVAVPSPRSDAIDWTPGGSGLVSTAGDYMRFALMLWNGGRYDGIRILSKASVEQMTQPHVREGVLVDEGMQGIGWGLGLAVIVDSEATPMIDRDGDFWWSGYYGTTFVVSPATGLVSVVLTQNQPSRFSPRPYPVHLASAFAFFGS